MRSFKPGSRMNHHVRKLSSPTRRGLLLSTSAAGAVDLLPPSLPRSVLRTYNPAMPVAAIAALIHKDGVDLPCWRSGSWRKYRAAKDVREVLLSAVSKVRQQRAHRRSPPVVPKPIGR